MVIFKGKKTMFDNLLPSASATRAGLGVLVPSLIQICVGRGDEGAKVLPLFFEANTFLRPPDLDREEG